MGTRVEFSFTPVNVYSVAMVVLDGKLVGPKGTISMSADHWLWAFGNPEIGKAFANVMTVPSDVTKIPYPTFYQKRPSFTFKVADPYCALTSNVIAYPSSYLGAFPMPPVIGAPLLPGILRGVCLRDNWNDTQKYNPGLNNGCRGSMYIKDESDAITGYDQPQLIKYPWGAGITQRIVHKYMGAGKNPDEIEYSCVYLGLIVDDQSIKKFQLSVSGVETRIEADQWAEKVAEKIGKTGLNNFGDK